MNVKSIVTTKCILMSACMGLLMGLAFTIINQLKQNGSLQPVGILISMGMSCFISIIVGIPLNMKKICDRVLGGWMGLNTIEPSKKWKYYIGESIIGSIIFTPFNMFANQLYGMYMGMKMANSFPPFVTSFGSGLKFLLTGPFWPAFGKGLPLSILIGIPISLVGTLVFGKITDKIVGID